MPGGPRHHADDQIAFHLARGRSAPEIAADAGVSERTIRRRMADPDFAATVARLRSQLIHEAAGQLAGLACEAIKTLEECLAGEKESDRIRSALGILDQMVKLRAAGEVEERLAAIESRLRGPS